ncbi:ATP-binding protein [Campylobacter sp. US33a]|uniref:ATP-binding protein n=1 Tax=Campylobacter sp. US33a TaxID=2498120 RepID=UPI001068044D|nr:ATP-binding protein [Campylobacter sp. US33a]TEY01992.1 ATP-binding protein [Campylobacter sp. US33a]
MNSDFVPLKQHTNALEIIQNTSNQQIIILLGKSGSGKSFLLKQLTKTSRTFLFSEPFFDEINFLNTLGSVILNKQTPSLQDFISFAKNSKEHYLILLDEAGMYEEALLEKIRILSDFKNFVFILSTHKIHKIFEKEHFKSRIGNIIVLNELSKEELSFYINTKFQLKKPFVDKELKLLQKISLNNLRTIDQILHTFIALYAYYEKQKLEKSSKFLLELCALHHNLRL